LAQNVAGDGPHLTDRYTHGRRLYHPLST
jgi:hypothetical protein